MTLAIGRRVIVVEGVERWRAGGRRASSSRRRWRQMPPETTLALFAREEARAKAPAGAARGGQARPAGRSWRRRPSSRGSCPSGRASRPRASGCRSTRPPPRRSSRQVGERQQRLLRELEKLALEGDAGRGRRRDGRAPRRSRSAPAHSAEWRAFALADALVGGDAREATRSYLRLREQGERLSGLIYLMAQRLREALAVALRLQAGESAAEVKRGLRMPPRAAERFVADVARSDPERLRAALGGAGGPRARLARRRVIASQPTARRCAALDEDTLALRAIEAIAVARLSERPRRRLARSAPARTRAARDFLCAPVLRCSAPRLTALSIVLTSSRCVGVGGCVVAALHERLEAAEVGLDRRGVVAVLQALALGAQDPLLL